jgi:hypothetical protein
MERSIAARYAARPAARFVTASSRARERRLGLGGAGTFRPATARQTILQHSSESILARLRGDWRAIRPAAPRPTDGRPRPAVRMIWTGSSPAGSAHRSSAATAPWRA